MKFTSIRILDDIEVTVPASLGYLTTFILYEQNDWFEDEMKFVRKLIEPGMKVVDIGANYGMYTLSIAKKVGENGKVWCFEPTQLTGECLKKSIADNKFSQVQFSNLGLSNRVGEATFYLSENSELNSLSNDFGFGTKTESISLTTLNNASDIFEWKDIDFIKLDAEGEELNILEGGDKVLDSMSPLIMYELKHGSSININLVKAFERYSYKSFHLIPGLDVIVPFDCTKQYDQYILNLFCCKEDQEQNLMSRNLLVTEIYPNVTCNKDLAKEHIESMPYFKYMDVSSLDNSIDNSHEYIELLNLYIASQQISLNAKQRTSCLFIALSKVKRMIEGGERNLTRLITFSRVAFDAGERVFGVEILKAIISKYVDKLDFQLNELFLPASKRFELIDPDDRIHEWLLSSVLEQYIVKHAYSSYFSKKHSMELLDKLENLGFMQDDMKIRLELLKKIYPKK